MSGKKLTAKKVNVSKERPGFVFAENSKFVGRTEKPIEYANDEGEIKEGTIPLFLFENEQGERTQVKGDAGLRSALEEAGIAPGDRLGKIIKLEQIDIGKGRRMNQYDVYSA